MGNNKKKKNNQEKKQTWAVLAILASVLLIAMIGSWLTSKSININEYSGGVNREKQEARENARNILIGAGVVCVGIIGVYFSICRKNKKKEKEAIKKAFLEKQKVEDARERVERARMMEMLKSGQDEIKKRRGEREILGKHHREKTGGAFDNIEDDDRLSRERYMEHRRREYQYLMENEDEEEGDGDALRGVSGKTFAKDDQSVRKKRYIIMTVGAGIALICITALVIIFVVL